MAIVCAYAYIAKLQIFSETLIILDEDSDGHRQYFGVLICKSKCMWILVRLSNPPFIVEKNLLFEILCVERGNLIHRDNVKLIVEITV